MSIKSIVKNALGIIRCTKNGVSAGKNVYVGKNVKFTGGRNILLGDNVNIRPGSNLFAGGVFSVGSGTEIGERCRFSGVKYIEIGQNVLFSPNVYITDCDHQYEDVTKPIICQGTIDRDNKVIVKDNAYIGINTVIVGNVTIGKGSVIGANSVVTHDVPDYSVAVGSPAKVIKKYNSETKMWEKV
ncbi:MAG: acyltransferase [Eubacterium sp.]